MSGGPTVPDPLTPAGTPELPSQAGEMKGVWFARLIAFQIGRPLTALGILALVTCGSLVLAAHLTLNTGFESLLPESRAIRSRAARDGELSP